MRAQLVLWPSAHDGGTPLWAYAYLNHYYVVSSARAGRSRKVDPCGTVLLETGQGRPVTSRDFTFMLRPRVADLKTTGWR